MTKMASISMVLCLAVLAACSASAAPQKVQTYDLRKGNFCVNLTNWGATIISVVLPDRHGKLDDVVLGYDSVNQYKNDTPYLGALVGRVANRIGGAKFELDGKTYKVVANEGKNTLHGGKVGFSDVVWGVKKYYNKGHAPFIIFTYRSVDGEQGFPGDLVVNVKYSIFGNDNNYLKVEMSAEALNKATPVNLAQHTYWNLGGHDSGDILANHVKIYGSHITLVDDELIPTGKLGPVKGTPYDFLEPHTVGSRIGKLPGGYDINYALDGPAGKLKRAALVRERKSGRAMVLWTDAPGVQFYTGNFLKDVKGKGGFVYQAHAALCLETQGFPDAVNQKKFPSTIVRPGKPYSHVMLFKFFIH